MAVGGRMPVVAYLTLLDKYMLLNSLFIILAAVQSRFATLVIDLYTIDTVVKFDFYSSIAFCGLWVLMQAWMIVRGMQLTTRARPREEMLAGNPEFMTIFKEGEKQSTTASQVASNLIQGKLPARKKHKLLKQATTQVIIASSRQNPNQSSLQVVQSSR